MESLKPLFALYGRKKLCTRTDKVFLAVSELSKWAVSLCDCVNTTKVVSMILVLSNKALKNL